jgi:hypothetical protein
MEAEALSRYHLDLGAYEHSHCTITGRFDDRSRTLESIAIFIRRIDEEQIA